MERITRISKGDILYATLFRQVETDSVRFLTQQSDELQAGVMERPAGYKVKPHRHPPHNVEREGIAEFLYVERGKIRVHVFNEEWVEVGDGELEAGDFLLFFRGGHSVDVLEDVRMIEVKMGPYPGEQAAKVFQK